MDESLTIQSALKQAFQEADLSTSVLWEKSQFIYPGENWVDLVLSDAGALKSADSVLKAQQERLASKGIFFDFLLRAKWLLADVGQSEVARTKTGNIVAATVVPIFLKSGSSTTLVHVFITWLAQETLRQLNGGTFDSRAIAHAAVTTWLERDGKASWDPLRSPNIEINHAAAAQINKLMKKAA